jgi:hypothetical protein
MSWAVLCPPVDVQEARAGLGRSLHLSVPESQYGRSLQSVWLRCDIGVPVSEAYGRDVLMSQLLSISISCEGR